MARYDEREITQTVMLCDEKGNLNPDALGWSRFPLHTCNLSGNFPRKKKWHFWIVLCEDFGIALTIAHLDYIGIGAMQFLDLKNKKKYDSATVLPRGVGLKMPDRVEEDVRLKDPMMKIEFAHAPGQVLIKASSPSFQGKKLSADIVLSKPADHETLNTVIPWSKDEFHFTSKQNTLPASGTVAIGDAVYEFKPESSYGILDFGRGMWPKTIIWNWGSFSHRQDDDLIGLNIGALWTDNTGHNENGICLNGRLFKIMEDVIFTYDNKDFMKPWTIKTSVSDTLDLKLTPVFDNSGGTNSTVETDKVIASSNQLFGHYSGTLRAGGRVIQIQNAFGWAEEHIGNW